MNICYCRRIWNLPRSFCLTGRRRNSNSRLLFRSPCPQQRAARDPSASLASRSSTRSRRTRPILRNRSNKKSRKRSALLSGAELLSTCRDRRLRRRRLRSQVRLASATAECRLRVPAEMRRQWRRRRSRRFQQRSLLHRAVHKSSKENKSRSAAIARARRTPELKTSLR